MSPAHVAQAVEHFLGKEKVPGSNPGVGSNSTRGLILWPFGPLTTSKGRVTVQTYLRIWSPSLDHS